MYRVNRIIKLNQLLFRWTTFYFRDELIHTYHNLSVRLRTQCPRAIILTIRTTQLSKVEVEVSEAEAGAV